MSEAAEAASERSVPIRLAVLAAPPLGHVSRLGEALKAAEAAAPGLFQIEVFVGGSVRSAQRFFEGRYPLHEVRCTSRDWVEQGARFARALRDQSVIDRFDAFLLDTNPIQWTYAVDFARKPVAIITNCFLTAMAGRRTLQVEAFEREADRFNAVRAEFGLRPLKSAYDLYETDLVLLGDPQPIVDFIGAVPGNYKSCGPCFWSAPGVPPQSISSFSNLLIASLGSTGRPDFSAELVSAIARAAGAEVTVCVGANPFKESPARSAFDYEFEQAPLNQLIRHAAVVITQGGAGSTYQALHQGRPVFIAPTHKNHLILGQTLEAVGGGRVLNGDARTTEITHELLETLRCEAALFRGSAPSPGSEIMGRYLVGFLKSRVARSTVQPAR
ncbi:MAG: hypothetical protein AAFX03_06780 [Pseudomonadota bacterium]